MEVSVALCIAALIIISITHWVYRWKNPKCNGKLPPGSMGWPLLGETLQFFAPSTSFDVHPSYTIPAGWAVMVCPPAVHMNPGKYKDPLDFNPWRWEGMELNGATRNFMAFGGGMRFCVGTDFTKVQMAVFLHCLVTKYKWQEIKGGDILRTPGLQFPNGFHIQVSEKVEAAQEST